MSDFEQTHGPPSTNSSALSVAGEEGRVSASTIDSTPPSSTNPSSTDLQQQQQQQQDITLQQRKRRSRTHSRLFGSIDRRMATTSSLGFEAGNDSKLDIVVEELKEVRVALVGGAGVGKTSLVRWMSGGNGYMPPPPPTTECTLHTREASANQPTFTIADTVGQHSGQPDQAVQDFLAEMEPHVFLLCFLLGDDESLAEILVVWSRFVRSIAPTAPMLLIGIGSDQLVDPLNGMWRLNLVYKAQRLINATDFIECSGLTGENVDRVLQAAHVLAQQAFLLQLEALANPPPERAPSRPASIFLSSRISIPNPSQLSQLSSNRLSLKRLSLFSNLNISRSTLDLNQAVEQQQQPRRNNTLRRIASAIRIKPKLSRTEGEAPARSNSVAPNILRKKSSLGNLLSPKRWNRSQN